MKSSFIIFLTFILVILNVLLLKRLRVLDAKLDNMTQLVNHRKNKLMREVGNINSKTTLKLCGNSKTIVLRYNENSCSQCVYEAEALVESVFEKSFLVLSPSGSRIKFPSITTIEYDSLFLPYDTIYTPYVCLLNNNGKAIFTLNLNPRDYDYNREILLSLKKAMSRDD